MKHATLFLSVFLLVACSSGPSSSEVESTVVVRVAQAVASTVEAIPTSTAYPTYTPVPTATRTARPTNTPRPTATPAPDFGSRGNPYPVGETAFLVLGDREFTVTFTGITRGDDALAIVRAANQFNDPPSEGSEYMVVTVDVDYYGDAVDLLEISQGDWSLITNNRIVRFLDFFTDVCCLEPGFDVELFSGGKAEGMLMAWPVVIGDPAPLLVLGMKSDGTGGLYFAAHE